MKKLTLLSILFAFLGASSQTGKLSIGLIADGQSPYTLGDNTKEII